MQRMQVATKAPMVKWLCRQSQVASGILAKCGSIFQTAACYNDHTRELGAERGAETQRTVSRISRPWSGHDDSQTDRRACACRRLACPGKSEPELLESTSTGPPCFRLTLVGSGCQCPCIVRCASARQVSPGRIAQLGERQTEDLKVSGSIPDPASDVHPVL